MPAAAEEERMQGNHDHSGNVENISNFIPAWIWKYGSCSLDATAMAALCTVVAYPARCEEIADTSDLTFSTYSDVRKWEQWEEPRMSKIRDHIRSIFETRDTNPIVITGSNACDY